MPHRRTSFFSLRTLALSLAAIGAAGLTLHCGGGGGGGTPDQDAGDETSDSFAADSTTDAPASDGEGGSDSKPIDTGSDATTPVTCKAAPTFGTPLHLNHNPDSLRQIANGTIALLADGRLVVVFLEALDGAATRYALFTRTIDPKTGTISSDTRLDVDADNLTATTPIDLSDQGNGALLLQYYPGGGARRVRVFSHDKWSPEIGAVMSMVDTDGIAVASSVTGTVLVARSHSATPGGQAVVYDPDSGGAFGAWSSPQTLDLPGASGTPTIQAMGLPDGRYLLLVWQSGGGPAVTLRSVSGAWTTPSTKAEIGATDASPSVRLLDDGTLLLVAVEGSGDTRRVVTSSWTEAAGWSTARLLSKTPTGNGVVPYIGGRTDPFLFSIGPHQAEFVAWVAECTTSSTTCSFSAIERTFTAGATDWSDPVDLKVGTTTTGADGLRVDALDDSTPIISRTATDGSTVQLRARVGATSFGPLQSILGPPLFDSATNAVVRFFGSNVGAWAVVARTETSDSGPSTTKSSVMGKIDPSGTTAPSWTAIVDAAGAEMHGFSPFEGYVDGNGAFTIALNDAVDSGGKNYPVVAHSAGTSSSFEIQRVVLSDETAAAFTNGPRFPPRSSDLDKSTLFLVYADVPVDGGTAHRLRAYAWNGVSGVKPQLLANETQSPRTFNEGLLTYGCGGAILYATDAGDGSHALNLVLVQ